MKTFIELYIFTVFPTIVYFFTLQDCEYKIDYLMENIKSAFKYNLERKEIVDLYAPLSIVIIFGRTKY